MHLIFLFSYAKLSINWWWASRPLWQLYILCRDIVLLTLTHLVICLRPITFLRVLQWTAEIKSSFYDTQNTLSIFTRIPNVKYWMLLFNSYIVKIQERNKTRGSYVTSLKWPTFQSKNKPCAKQWLFEQIC